MAENLVLGTAQFGMPYGIANKNGQPDQDMVTTIVHEAWERGIREFDTAQGYGTSEQVLGKALLKFGLIEDARVVSKFNPKLDHLNINDMSNALNESLERVGVSYIYGMMLHREEMLSLWDKGLSKILHDFVASGKIKNIGVSVYSPEKAIQALNTVGIDMVQLPTNILDRRFEEAGVFQLADKKRKKIYIRSVFLKGLILMDINEIPEKMFFVKPIIEKLESLSRDLKLSRQELALRYIKTERPQAKVVIGVDTPKQIKENIKGWNKQFNSSLAQKVKKLFNNVDERVVNPVLWPN